MADLPLDDAAKLTDLRRRVLAGENITADEYRLVVNSMRSKRSGDISAAATKPTARGVAKQAKTKAEAVDLATLLAGVKKKLET